MPRDANGIYTLPLPPVAPGAVITSAWGNGTTNDLATAMTGSLSRNGEGAMLAPLRLQDGSTSVPSLAFSNENGAGLHRQANNDIRFSMGTLDLTRWTLTNEFEVQRDHGAGPTWYPVYDSFIAGAAWDARYGGFKPDGNHLTAVDDLDTILLNSRYTMPTTPINAPADYDSSNNGGFLQTIMNSGSNGMQYIYGRLNANQGKIWQRLWQSSVWGEWFLIVGRPINTIFSTIDIPAYIPSPGAVSFKVQLIGAGGGGGGADGQDAGTTNVGGGGASGGNVIQWVDRADFAASYPIVIGAGGSGGSGNGGVNGGSGALSSMIAGTVNISITGGGGGEGSATTGNSRAAGGETSSPSGGDVSSRGAPGGTGFAVNGEPASVGIGGASVIRGGGMCRSNVNGTSGSKGAGGGGGYSFNQTANTNGGAGGSGYVIIEEYF